MIVFFRNTVVIHHHSDSNLRLLRVPPAELTIVGKKPHMRVVMDSKTLRKI